MMVIQIVLVVLHPELVVSVTVTVPAPAGPHTIVQVAPEGLIDASPVADQVKVLPAKP